MTWPTGRGRLTLRAEEGQPDREQTWEAGKHVSDTGPRCGKGCGAGREGGRVVCRARPTVGLARQLRKLRFCPGRTLLGRILNRAINDLGK